MELAAPVVTTTRRFRASTACCGAAKTSRPSFLRWPSNMVASSCWSARLKPGMFARVSLELDSRSDVVVVPEQAISPRGDKTFLFKVVDGKALLIEVKLGARRMGEVEITQGVTAGDLVITENQPMLQPGMAVKVVG